MRRLLTRGFLALLVLFIVVAGAAGLWVHSSLPVTDGTLTFDGLGAPVRVSRDAHGIPTIRAQSEHDADFALGFLHAQDRLFQMDMMRRYGAGRLSEVFGSRTLASDRTMRTFGLYRAAEAQFAVLSPEVQQVLTAYAAGINAFLATRKGAFPPEYLLVGANPEPWRPADSLVWGKLMDLQLTGNLRGEITRALLLQRLSPDELSVLYPSYPKDAPVALENERAMLERLPLQRLYAALPPDLGPQRASNEWVVDGAHSQSGKPLLANDPHLDFSAPGVWYLVRIVLPGETLTGVTAPGTPFLLVGHNDRIAWGFTTTGGDVEDLFVEKPDPADPTRYLTQGGTQPFELRKETIAVKDAAPVTLTVRATRHGPVVSDLGGYSVGDDVLALEATWLAPDDRTPDAIYGLAHARDWDGFRHALQSWTAPQQNIVYADVDGNIGFMAPGRIPIRAAGDGWLPAPGWDDTHDWTGTVPFDALPTAFNPRAGRIFTANNKIVPDDYPYLLTRDWELPYRAERIAALLDATPSQSPDSSAAIQADLLSLPAQILLPLMLQAVPASDEARAAMDRLNRWDRRMDRNKAEPLIFTAWLRELGRALMAPKLGHQAADTWRLRPDVVQNILTEHRDWCGQAGNCGTALSQSLERALGLLRARYGSDMGAWRWGAAHEAAFASPVWAQVPLLARLFDASLPADGDDDTVNAGGMYLADDAAPFLDRHGPSLRMIVDMAAPQDARFMIAPGESGNPLSPHWGDLARPWRNVRSLSFGDDESGGVLVFTPPPMR
ncbi:MAG TPA: penicillin acylase family protein [Stellaceae bacterium]|nr:penicillin acylase family protein [Stellaceae bacterium]